MPLPFEESLIRVVFEIVNQSSFLRLITIFLGSVLPWIIIIWFIISLFRVQGFRLKFYYFALAVISIIISRVLIVGIINKIFYFSRPFEAFDISPIISHALTSGLLSGYMAVLMPIVLIFFLIHKKSGVIIMSLVFFVGIARIAAGVYWSSTVLAGLILGALSFLLVKIILLPNLSILFICPPKTDEKREVF